MMGAALTRLLRPQQAPLFIVHGPPSTCLHTAAWTRDVCAVILHGVHIAPVSVECPGRLGSSRCRPRDVPVGPLGPHLLCCCHGSRISTAKARPGPSAGKGPGHLRLLVRVVMRFTMEINTQSRQNVYEQQSRWSSVHTSQQSAGALEDKCCARDAPPHNVGTHAPT
jgi:hypothetical protein